MNIIITQEFIECQFIENDKLIHDILNTYTQINFFINFNEIDVLNEESILQIFKPVLELNNEIVQFENLEDFSLEMIQNSRRSGIIIFKTQLEKVHDSFKGQDFIFDFKSLDQKMKTVRSKLEFRIDLSDINYSDEINSKFQYLQEIPFHSLVISDPYILKEKSLIDLKMLLHSVLKNSDHAAKVVIIAKLSELQKKSIYRNNEDEIKRVYTKLNSLFSQFNLKFFFIDADFLNAHGQLNVHDRLVYHPFWVLESGKGFDIFSKKKNYNSKVESSSFFDSFTYKRKVNHLNRIQLFLNKVYNGSIASHQLIIYPKLKEQLEVI